MVDAVCILAYFLLGIVWIVLLLIGGGRYSDMIEGIEDGKGYGLKNLFGVGFLILDILHYSYDTLLDRKRLDQAKIVYGEKYYQFYYRVNMAEKMTYVSLGIALAPLFGAMLGNSLFCLLGLLVSFLGYYYADMKITDVIKEREISIIKDFADVVSKLALLINAGMITREAWEEIAATGDGVLYQEMQTAVLEMQNGTSEVDAYIRLGNRCGIPLVKKFVSMLVQNLSKGNRELVMFLKAEAAVCWEEKKHVVKRQGEAAASKLMLPLGIILVGIFVMIMVPIIGNLGI